MPVRILAGEIAARDATVRSVIPSSAQPKWPPVELLAETIATPRRRFPAHGHVGVEVFSYVIEGSGLYSYGTNPPEPLGAGSVQLLTAGTQVAHAINPGKGQTLRWLAVVVTLSPQGAPTNRLQSARMTDGPVAPDGTRTRNLVGAASTVRSSVGLEAYELAFAEEGTTFRRVGHGVNAVGYALSGAGTVDGRPVELGEAAVIEESAGVAIQGRPGFRIVLVHVPRPA